MRASQVYRYCERARGVLKDRSTAGKTVYHWCSTHPHRRANAACLAGAFAVLCLHKTAEEAFRPFLGVYPPFSPFRDAAFGLCTYTLTILDCLRALAKVRRGALCVQCFLCANGACCRGQAKSFGFVDFDDFDIDDYERYDHISNGDINWIIPGKFIAFSGPLDEPKELADGGKTWTPEDYVPVFKKKGIRTVVRLNKPHYNKNIFERAGIRHADLFYPDGGVPPDPILAKFLALCEADPAGVAVHCKAGLGRTGTCIGAYLQKHYKFTAKEVIGWCRICRPGSIIGPQQHYLESIEEKMWKAGTDAGAVPRGVVPAPVARKPHPKVDPEEYSGRGSGAGGAGTASGGAGGRD